MNDHPKDKEKMVKDISSIDFSKLAGWKSLNFSKGNFQRGEVTHEILITFNIKGSWLASIGKFKDRTIMEGEISLIPTNCSYYIEALEDSLIVICPFSMDNLLFLKPSFDDLVPYYKDFEYDFNALKTKNLITEFLFLMNEYIANGLDSFYFSEIKKQELFYLLFSLYSPQELAKFLFPIIGEDLQFKEFVTNNYLRVKNVGELAALANYSTSGFIKKFQCCFNEPPYKWISRHKAERIRIDISSGLLSLKEIAFKYNFSTYQRFGDFCKAQFGLSPSTISKASIHTHLNKSKIDAKTNLVF